MNKNNNLIWIDIEMTGLYPERDRILEICVVITDFKFNIITDHFNVVLSQPEELLNGMDNWNTTHHSKSGLLDEVKSSTIDELQAEQQILDFLKNMLITMFLLCVVIVFVRDRRFLYQYMPKLAKYFHYRNLDVSNIKDFS